MSALLQMPSYLEQLPIPDRGGRPPEENWTIQPLEGRRLPRPAHENEASDWKHLNREMPRISATNDLESLYVIDNHAAVDAFLQQHRSVTTLLLAAPEALNTALGESSIRVLKLLCDDDGGKSLFCYIMIASDLPTAMRALQAFDEDWWLARCAQVAGRLNFDVELI
jgi:hypothetical protein